MLLGIELAGRAVVVAGGGQVATRRIAALRADGAVVTCIAPEASESVAELAQAGAITWHARDIGEADVDGAWLVVAATSDPAVNTTVAGWAAARRIFCVQSGDAAAGSARFPASGEVAGVAFGVLNAESPDPARAARVRDQIAAAIDDGELDLRGSRPAGGRVVLVGAGPGDEALATVAARRELRRADVVVADRLGTASALARLGDDVEVIDVGKAPGRHAATQAEINALIVERALAGQYVVRLKGGDPFVFGRGGEEAHACLAAGVAVEVVPGVTSALSVPARAGIPVTQRGIARSVLVTSGHDGAAPEAISAMLAGATVSILMGVGRLGDISDAAMAAGVPGDTAVAIIESGTVDGERVTRGDLASIKVLADETGVKPPAIIVVGSVAQPGLLESAAAQTPREEANGDDQ